MRPHRFLPVPLELDEPARPPLWRCVGCGTKRNDPTPQLGDNCPAESMDLDGAA